MGLTRRNFLRLSMMAMAWGVSTPFQPVSYSASIMKGGIQFPLVFPRGFQGAHPKIWKLWLPMIRRN